MLGWRRGRLIQHSGGRHGDERHCTWKEKSALRAGQRDSRWQDDPKSLSTGVAILVLVGLCYSFYTQSAPTFYIPCHSFDMYVCPRSAFHIPCNRRRPGNCPLILCY
jgi:hypothetical protein